MSIKTYENIVLMGDFNAEPSNIKLKYFMADHNLYNTMKHKTCFKSVEGKCIDLILTNIKHSLQKSNVFETGLSDHHILIYSMLKITYQKLPPKIIAYRSYKLFNENHFIQDLSYYLNYYFTGEYSSFQSIFEYILNDHAPLKKNTIRDNQKPHMSQNLRKAIMKRSHLKNIANKTKSQDDFMQYKKQRNYVVKLNKQEKKIFFHSVDPKGLKPKTFWQACKPLFTSNTHMGTERLLLVQDNEIISNDIDIATLFNNYFNNITSKLAIKNWDKLGRSEDPILNAIEKYSEHSSIIKIKSIFQTGDTFVFENISSKNVLVAISQSKSYN